MAEGYVTFAPVDDSEDSTFTFPAPSTVPTTPDGSCSFSPVLKYCHGLEHEQGDAVDVDEDSFTELDSRDAESDERLQSSAVRNICCVGAGYVGGPTAAVIAFQNPHIRVTIVDRDEGRIRRWNSKHPPIYEPGLRDIVRVARDGARSCSFPSQPLKPQQQDTMSEGSSASSEGSGRRSAASITVPAREPNLFFSTQVSKSISEADVVLIAVNTPTKTRGHGAGSATDMAAFEAVTAQVARHAKPGAIIVEKSTVPCRTAHLVRETLAVHRPGVRFEVLSNPGVPRRGHGRRRPRRPGPRAHRVRHDGAVQCLNNTLAGKNMAVLGYAFKKNTSDTREAPALEMIRTLLEEGPREVAVFDPCCNPLVIREEIRQLCGTEKPPRQDGGPLVVYGNAYDACRDSIAILVATECDEFRSSSSSNTTIARKASAAKRREQTDPRPFRTSDLGQRVRETFPGLPRGWVPTNTSQRRGSTGDGWRKACRYHDGFSMAGE
ncbi:UDP-glucose 6-dehydrogenase 1 [Colletotrichum orbiculare MAFF 240422]|uniref:UDP-glucose 6-dehydrogenase 1 n=1 Tax=Colletotrichum orbiculare (strain 104-T / ATCC 96160 / CBS 514.97 / LARS 414 / MAFF 240422) TaxID=1213857 RepID=N4UYH9_COLOR|nr:UDP-glucose 6-dehydrogenase 1 [Colletotrichum orbiculare MAFF 240422]